jgi:PAS domain-containing protein
MTISGNAWLKTGSFTTRAALRGSPVRWLIVGGVLLMSAIVIGTGMMVGVFRERALQSAERELDNTVLLLARHFDQQLEDFVTIQREVAAESHLARLSSPDAFKARMSTADFHEVLKAKVSGHADVAGVNIFDADGKLINSSESWPVPKITVSDRNYFKAFKSGTAATSVLIALVNGRFTGQWATVISHNITGPNGEFLGMVTRAITPANFEKFFASLTLGADAAISLYHSDGTLLARYPHIEEMIGRNFSTGPVHQEVLSKADHGTIRLTSPMDGVDRLASTRKLSEFPVSVIATTTVAAALTDWREQTRFLVIVASLSVMVIAGVLFLVVRKLSRQHRMEKQRLDTAVNNIPQGLVVYDDTAHVTVCNRRYIEMFGLSAQAIEPGCTMQDLIAAR